jgi:sugar phosphate permease
MVISRGFCGFGAEATEIA